MKHVRFRDPAGAVRHGTWHDGGDEIRFGNEEYTVDDVDILAPCEPSKIVCVGRNYADHAAEMGNDVPDRPRFFFKPPNTVTGYRDHVTLPSGKERLDHEAELALVIGQQCRHLDESEAMDVVEGFTCMNDLSNRDDQQLERNYVRGKGFDGAAPLGPVIATPDEVPDDAYVRGRVNGELRQDSTLEHLIFSIPELLAEITAYLTLEAGDVVATGTPDGVGSLGNGDEIEIEVKGVGTLEHTVRIP